MTKTLTNEEILKKAIEKAEKNGYKSPYFDYILKDLIMKVMHEEDLIFSIIFSHDFAKSFWGEEMICPHCEWFGWKTRFNKRGIAECERPQALEERFLYHLQQMVLETEPLKYLERFLYE